MSLDWILYLIAFHSIGVGLLLIIRPKALMEFAGFSHLTEPFFPVQGGMFHLLIAIAYFMAGYLEPSNVPLYLFIILVKFLAACFLLCYYKFFEKKWIILVSGLGDGLMGLAVLLVLTIKI